MTRSQLCELLWDVPNDPRGELRWSLSKVRSLVDERGRRRVQTRGDTVWLDLSDCLVDAIEVARATGAGIETLPPDRQRALAALFSGDFLEGLEHRPQPGLRRVAHRPAPAIPRLPRGPAGAPRQARARRRGVPIPGAVAPAGALRSARPRAPAERVRPARPDPGRRGAPGRDRPAVRGRRPRRGAAARRLAVSEGARWPVAGGPGLRSVGARGPDRTPSSSRRLAAPPSR